MFPRIAQQIRMDPRRKDRMRARQHPASLHQGRHFMSGKKTAAMQGNGGRKLKAGKLGRSLGNGAIRYSDQPQIGRNHLTYGPDCAPRTDEGGSLVCL